MSAASRNRNIARAGTAIGADHWDRMRRLHVHRFWPGVFELQSGSPGPDRSMMVGRSRHRILSMNASDDCPYVVMPTSPRSSGAGRPITCSCIQSRGTADESEAYFFRRLGCFGDDVVVRVSRSGDDLQICCSYQRNFYPIEGLCAKMALSRSTRRVFVQPSISARKPIFVESRTVRSAQGGGS
jgi:hypothetical protein